MTAAGRRQLRQRASQAAKQTKELGVAQTSPLTEAQWANRVAGLASFYGWLRYHPADNVPSVTTGTIDRIMRGKQPPTSATQLAGMLRRKTRRANIEPGFPDWVFARHDDNQPAELLFIELKTDTGRVSTEQQAWLTILQAIAAAHPGGTPAPVEAHVWRPAYEDIVHHRLARGRVRQQPTW